MSDPSLGLLMLGLIVVAIMMGFPTAFTLMGLGMLFGFVAFLSPAQHWYDNRVFDLMVQRTYGVMTNDTLLSIPLFVFMGYVMERAALVDRMFHSVQLAFRRVPASLAVTTLLVCAFWGIASGIVGAVVVLMGVIALRPMLNAGYDVRLASGAITAGGTLGILIPPSVMLIVYAAVAGQSIVKLYAAAMLPGFFLTFLYLVYILGWAIINPKIAPNLPPDKYRLSVPAWLRSLERGPSRRVLGGLIAAALRPAVIRSLQAPDGPVGYSAVIRRLLVALVPLLLTVATFGATWWYFVVYNAPAAAVATAPPESAAAPPTALTPAPPAAAPESKDAKEDETPQELGSAAEPTDAAEKTERPDAPPEQMGSPVAEPTTARDKTPAQFYPWFWSLAAVSVLLLALYYWRMDGERLEILRELVASVVPLGVLTFVVLAVILFGITTATESAAVGALGALYLAALSKRPRQVWWWSLGGLIVGLALGARRGDVVTMIVSGALGAVFAGNGRAVARDAAQLARAPSEPQGVDVPHREDDGHGLLALRRLGAVLGGVRAARRPVADRALGAQHEPLAARLSHHRAAHHLPARVAARVDRDHRHLLPDLHPAPEPLRRRPDPVRHDGGGEPPGRVPVAARGDVGVLLEGRGAEARDAQPDLRGDDAVHADRHSLSRVHVHLPRHDALAAGVPVRELDSEGGCAPLPTAPRA